MRSGMEGTKFLDENNKAKIQTRILNEKVEVKFNFADIKWENNNKDTFIIYSCSEGLFFLVKKSITTLILFISL
jgi:hypothetical protein